MRATSAILNAMKKTRFVVMGLGGYGLVHLDAVAWLESLGLARLVGVIALEVDRRKQPQRVAALQQRGVTLYDNLNQFLAGGAEGADILTVPIGIHEHVPVTIRALQAGLHVYCEKPIAATIQDVDRLIAAQQQTGRQVAIGFQHIYSHSMQTLKARICKGPLGPVQKISLMCGWPRSIQYYSRNQWAGKLRLHDQWILDTPANNAHAHYLFNVLYLASPHIGRAAVPVEMQAALYRANKIESADLVQMKFTTNSGAAAHVLLAHCNARELGPVMQIICEKGTAAWHTDNGETRIHYRDGGTERFNNLTHEKWRFDGFRDFVDAFKKGGRPLCTPELARAHTLAVNAMHESCPKIATIPEEHIEEVEDWEMFPPQTKGRFRRAKELDAALEQAFAQDTFLHEMPIPWANPIAMKRFVVEGYKAFPQNSDIA